MSSQSKSRRARPRYRSTSNEPKRGITKGSATSSNYAGSKHRHLKELEFWTVVNELPDRLPVGRAELEAIERYLEEVIEECLQKQVSSQR